VRVLRPRVEINQIVLGGNFCRVVPNRQAQPEAYRLYLELLGQYTVAPVCTESVETKAM
jgi:hypothetical protein